MFDYLRTLITTVLISISTMLNPAVQLTTTPPPETIVSISPTPSPDIVSLPTSTTPVGPQTKDCQFNRQQMIDLMKQYSYAEEDINKFLALHPDNCFNLNPSMDRRVKTVNKNSGYVPQPSPTPIEFGKAPSYQHVGDITYGSDGSSYTDLGGTTMGSNGTNYNTVGSYTYGSDGTSYIKSGDWTFGNNGTSCYSSSGITTCSGGQ